MLHITYESKIIDFNSKQQDLKIFSSEYNFNQLFIVIVSIYIHTLVISNNSKEIKITLRLENGMLLTYKITHDPWIET